jgi:hypothetical protein
MNMKQLTPRAGLDSRLLDPQSRFIQTAAGMTLYATLSALGSRIMAGHMFMAETCFHVPAQQTNKQQEQPSPAALNINILPLTPEHNQGP